MGEKGRKRRGNSRFVFFFVLILVVLISVSLLGYQQLRKSEWLNIKNISISGNENTTSATIQTLLREFMGENLLEVSVRDVQTQLLKIKRIEKVRMTRLYPSTLKVKVTERKGFLYIKSAEGDLFPIDEHGMVIEYSAVPSTEDLPIVHTKILGNQLHAGRIIKEPFLNRVIDLQKQIVEISPDFLKIISEYYELNNHVVLVDAKYGTRVLLGTEDLPSQLKRYQFVQENGDINRKNIIDLRFQNQVVVRPEVR